MKSKILTFLVSITIVFVNCDKKENSNPVSSFKEALKYAFESQAENTFWYDGNMYEMSTLTDWGLGSTEISYYHCDREYDWYIDQVNTGPSSNNNCGPSSVTMAAKWYEQSFSQTAEDARNMYPRNGGWWYTNDIINYLSNYSIPHNVYEYTDANQLTEYIKQGNIMILCISMEYIRKNNNAEHRVDKFYDYSSGHFLIVKGVRTVDQSIFFEVYDPNNWDNLYADNTQKGKNRHYRMQDVDNAISNWWNYLIVIHSNKELAKAAIDQTNVVDPETIEHTWGK